MDTAQGTINQIPAGLPPVNPVEAKAAIRQRGESRFKRDADEFRKRFTEMQGQPQTPAPVQPAPILSGVSPMINGIGQNQTAAVPPLAGAAQTENNPPPATAPQATPASPVTPIIPQFAPPVWNPEAWLVPTTAAPLTPVSDATSQQAATQAQDNAELAALRKELEDLRAEREKNKQSQEIEALLAGTATEFSTISPEDAKRFASILVPAVETKLEQRTALLEQQLSAITQASAEANKRAAEAIKRQTFKNTYGAIMTAHPDFEAVSQTPQFAQLLATPVAPGSSVTNGQLAMQEYQNGNPAYVISLVNQLKTAGPDFNQIVQVNGSAPGGNVGGAAPPTEMSYTAVGDIVQDYRSGKISRVEYQAALAKHREAARAPKLK